MKTVSQAAALIRKARNEAGLSQAELGRRLGMSQAAIAKLERSGSNPTVDTLDDVLWATGRRLELGATHRPLDLVDVEALEAARHMVRQNKRRKS